MRAVGVGFVVASGGKHTALALPACASSSAWLPESTKERRNVCKANFIIYLVLCVCCFFSLEMFIWPYGTKTHISLGLQALLIETTQDDHLISPFSFHAPSFLLLLFTCSLLLLIIFMHIHILPSSSSSSHPINRCLCQCCVLSLLLLLFAVALCALLSRSRPSPSAPLLKTGHSSPRRWPCTHTQNGSLFPFPLYYYIHMHICTTFLS